jgi:transcriptional repressor NrdR
MEHSSVIRRRRECLECKRRFTTYERLEEVTLMVVKSDGRRDQFNRTKLREGLVRACQKRPISSDAIDRILNEVENDLQDYVLEVPSRTIGEKVLSKLWELDSIAYIRFASVYHQYDNIDTFIEELKKLKKAQEKKTASKFERVTADK